MEKTDIQKHVLEYAHNKLSPFTAAIAFDNIDTIDTPKQVSDALGRLYNQRVLARRKVDKIRYEYIRAEIRPVGFEMAPEQPAAEPKTTEQTTIKSEARPTENEQNHEDHNLTEELRAQRTPAAGDCTLTDDQLIIKAQQWISKLCDSGGKAWILKIPVDHNNDPDMIFYELAKRFSESRLSKINAKSIIEPIQDQKQPDWLKAAHDIVHGDREKTYGDPGKNLRLIAQYWSTHTGITITETDVCIMMQLLKIARLRNDPEHDDSWIDIIGYAALKNRIKNECDPKASS